MNTHSKELFAVLFGRRSIRSYAPGDIDEQTVQLILEAAMSAPSAVGKDPWRFVVIRDKAILSSIADALPNGRMLAEATVGFVVCGDIEAVHDRQLSYLLQDCSAAIQNLLLAVHGLGLGGCWMGVHPRQERIDRVTAILGLPPTVIPVAAIAVGHPGEEKEPRNRFNPRYVHREKWLSH